MKANPRERKNEEPIRIGDLVTRLMARRGYAQVLAVDNLRVVWSRVAGTLANDSLPGNLNRGTLEIIACNSSVVQELTFRKRQLLRDLRIQLPKSSISGLRFRVGAID